MTKKEVLNAGRKHRHTMVVLLKRNGLWVCSQDCSRRELRPTPWRKAK